MATILTEIPVSSVRPVVYSVLILINVCSVMWDSFQFKAGHLWATSMEELDLLTVLNVPLLAILVSEILRPVLLVSKDSVWFQKSV